MSKYVCLLVVAWAATAGWGQTTQPRLWDQLLEINGRAAGIKDLSADFTQTKITPLLRKPLVSSGQVRVVGKMMRWDTAKPAPSAMMVDEQQVQMYYPQQATEEVYKLDERMAQLAASPLPRLDVLKQFFSFAALPGEDAKASGFDVKPGETLALRLMPTEASLKEHVEEVRVLLEVKTGLMLSAEIRDPDGDRTQLSFSNVKRNSGISTDALKLVIPPGTAISRPLAGLEDRGEGTAGKSTTQGESK